MKNLNNNNSKVLRPSTKEDFKIGTTLITSEGYEFFIYEHYSDGMWNARGLRGQGGKVVNESDARFYNIQINN